MLLEDLYRLMKTGHVQAQGVVDTMTQPVVVLDHSLCVTTANNAFIKAFKVERDDLLSQNFFSLGNGQWDIPELRQLIAAVIPQAAAVIGFEVTHDFPTIGKRTFLVDVRRLVHPDDNSPNLLVLFEDVTDRRLHDAETDFIVAEMRHRLKNLSAVVRSVVTNARSENPTVSEFKDMLLGRLDVTFKAQDIAASGHATDFESLLRQSVGTTVEERLECVGPATEIGSSKVLAASMIFHELGTNAIKHGPISSPGGNIRVAWTVENGPRNRRILVCEWQEENGPPVVAQHRGYGIELMEGLAAYHGGSLELTFPASGLRAVIKIPV